LAILQLEATHNAEPCAAGPRLLPWCPSASEKAIQRPPRTHCCRLRQRIVGRALPQPPPLGRGRVQRTPLPLMGLWWPLALPSRGCRRRPSVPVRRGKRGDGPWAS